MQEVKNKSSDTCGKSHHTSHVVHHSNIHDKMAAQWNEGPYAVAPNDNTLDKDTMTSTEAQDARTRSAAVMEALRNGKPGEADRLMGERVDPGTRAWTPIGWLGMKIVEKKRAKKEKKEREGKEKGDGIVR